MHGFLSSVLSFFLSPFIWILILLIAGYFKPSLKKQSRITAVIIFLVFSNGWLLNKYARKFQYAPLQLNAGTVFSCGIVPGGFASPDIDGNAVFNSTADRFIQVLTLFKQGHIEHILVSGGNGKKEMKSFQEAAWVKKQLVILGVPDSVIFIEDQSANTAENAVNAKKILEDRRLAQPYLLISSAHHLPRAVLLFKNNGMTTVAYPCSYIAGRGITTINDFVPNLGVLFTWNIFLKETAGYYWYK